MSRKTPKRIRNQKEDEDQMSEGKKLAEEHATWLFDLLRKVYVEAFEHGYKHGWDDYYEMVKEDEKND